MSRPCRASHSGPETPRRVPFQLILDFDGTITQSDTIGNVARAALEWRKAPDGGGKDLTAHWQRILDLYSQDLAAYDQSQPSEEQRTTLAHELAYLRGCRLVEQASLDRVRESRIFDDFAAQHRLFEAGRRDRETGATRIRVGFSRWMEAQRGGGDLAPSIHVVSVNFSASYIRGVLEPWLQNISSVIANEVQVDGSITASLQPPELVTECSGALTTSQDKLAVTNHLLGNGLGPIRLYLGDSTTDLECLIEYGGYALDADGRGKLLRTLRRLGYFIPHASSCTSAVKAKHICWARDFDEIL